jgi:glycosyltransferase involved in cell wall biosynthesis
VHRRYLQAYGAGLITPYHGPGSGSEMKVLKIIHTIGHGGAENTFRWLAWGLQRQGVEVLAAVPGNTFSERQKENWLIQALDELEVPRLTFDSAGSGWQLYNNIKTLIGNVKPDLVHSHLLDSNFYSAMACRSVFVPHVCTEHGDVLFASSARMTIKYSVISLCSRFVVCVSEAVRKAAGRFVWIGRKLKSIYNGIHFLESRPSIFRKEFHIPEDSILIGNVGNLYPVKGQNYLIRAFSKLQSVYPNTVLALVGRGREEGPLRQLSQEVGIPANRIIFTGFRNDVENIMNAFDLYVQPSLSEGHPVAVLEAMSLGVPVIATAVGGVPEILQRDHYGTPVDAKSDESLYQSMQAYMMDRAKFLARASAAKQYVRGTFSIERMAMNYIDCYEKALA